MRDDTIKLLGEDQSAWAATFSPRFAKGFADYLSGLLIWFDKLEPEEFRAGLCATRDAFAQRALDLYED